MKITNRRLVGRYVNPATGRPVNIHKGQCSGGWDRYFYLYRHARQFVAEGDFRKWEKAKPD